MLLTAPSFPRGVGRFFVFVFGAVDFSTGIHAQGGGAVPVWLDACGRAAEIAVSLFHD